MGRFGVAVLLVLPWLVLPAVLDSGSPDAAARIEPDDGGGITDWILCASDTGHELFLPTLAEIILKGPHTAQFHILYSAERTREDLVRFLRQVGFRSFGKLRWCHVQSEVPYWARDLFVVGRMRRAGPVMLLLHPEHYRFLQKAEGGDGAGTLAGLRSLGGFREKETRARLEGGAVVASARHAFLSPIYPRLAVLAGDFKSAEAARAYLAETFGRPIVALDVPPSPAYQHADTYFTPLEDDLVLLGDPGLATKLLRGAPRASLADFTERTRALGATNPWLASLAGDLGENRAPPLPDRRRAKAMDEVTARLERQLTGLGYRVRRIPWPVLCFARAGAEIRLSYNNVILERRGGAKTVWLPRYGIPPVDDAARDVWESEGWRVIFIDALGPGLFGGGVRCLSQVFRM